MPCPAPPAAVAERPASEAAAPPELQAEAAERPSVTSLATDAIASFRHGKWDGIYFVENRQTGSKYIQEDQA
ncbi:hypothetical protein GHYDROH2_24940 [Geobacter hydrogenophilus]|uniref:Uncharacterized protein n=1 Tax=Geobacter hydrogenophilus TaxID=40983 RepID=A0A9W6G278_9BACT|nr:hypothetical protein GHYDROH2_24940 [Geobacter hydrogenophilus]